MENQKALEFLSRFAIAPAALQKCGSDDSPSILENCITSGDCKGVEEELRNFIALYPNLKTISEITGLPVFSHEVAKAYWLGGDLLEQAEIEHYEILLSFFAHQGVPQDFIEELRANTPKDFIPFHLFQVLHVGAGKHGKGSLPNLDDVNNCMIRWGEILKINGKEVVINLHQLEFEDGKYNLTRKRETLQIDLRFVPEVKIGDKISIHWGVANKILTQMEVKNLKKWTKKVLNAIGG